MTTVDVCLDELSYRVHLGYGVLAELPLHLKALGRNRKVVLIYDTYFETSVVSGLLNTLEQQGFYVTSHGMDAGKGNKTIHEALKVYALLEEENIPRDAVLIALGGGVVGDLAGFIASTWLRGMKLIHVPTTLLAMVDSCIGGKTGINFRNTINAIGSYHHPAFVLMDLDFINSLSLRDYRSGLAEVIKCALINDKELFVYLDQQRDRILAREEECVVHFIRRAIQIKIEHVNGDVREGGKRLLLNYGHTLGHAIEMSTNKNGQEQLRHGEGVAIGMIAVAFLAERHLQIAQEVQLEIECLLVSYGLPTTVSATALGLNPKMLYDKCLRTVLKDKKRINDGLRLILANSIGHASVYEGVPFSLVEEAFRRVLRD